MRKKIFTLLTLMLAVCSGAWAETTYTFTKSAGYRSSEITISGEGVTKAESGKNNVYETKVSVTKNNSAEAYISAISDVRFTYTCGGSDKSGIIQFNKNGVYANGGNVHINVLNVAVGSEITLSIKSKNSTAISLNVVSGATADANNAESFTSLTNMKYTATATSVEINNPSNGFILESITVSDPPETYSVTYKANNGTDEEFVDNAAISAAANSFSYEGHTFTGWNTAAEGSGIAYAVGATISSDLTLYAQWIITPNYTLTYDANGGTGTMGDTEGYGSITLTALAYSKVGYSFMGWATSQVNADAGTVAYADKGSYTLSANATLYAVWSENDYSFVPTETSGNLSLGDEVETSTGGTMVTLGTPMSYTANGVMFSYKEGDPLAGVEVTLEDGMQLQAGSVIVTTFYNPNSTSRGMVIANSAGTAKATYSLTEEGTHIRYYTVTAGDGIAGTNKFRVMRNNNAYLKSLAVVNCVAVYDITHATAANGTYTIKVGSADAVNTDTEAAEGATVTLSATPSDGYALSDWNVTKTASGDAVTVTDNTFTMPAEAVTVAPTFERGVTLTWNVQVNVAETTVTTSSTSSSYTTYVDAPSNLGLTDLTVTSDPKGTASNKISTTKAKGGYVSATFDVKSGYMFTPTKMELATTAISEAITIEVNVGDEVQTWAQPKSGSSPDEHTYTFSDVKAYTGTVTMKIYAYGGSDGTKGFRLGTPIKVYGKISEISGPADPTTSGDEVYLTTSDNMAGWRAFYDADNSYTLDGNTKAYIATEQDGDAIKLKALERGIPAATPVILNTSSSADSHKMTLTKATVDAYNEGTDGANLLQYTTSAVTDKYRLGFGGNGVGFYPYTGVPTSGAVILNVSSASARALSIVFDEEETGIKKIENAASDRENGAYFNLAGQRVAQPTKGLYIVNGKKVVIK